jgi:hypothetical protein
MRQHRRFIAAFCDDLWDMCLNGKQGTPRADAVCEISRQLNSREAGSVQQTSASDK